MRNNVTFLLSLVSFLIVGIGILGAIYLVRTQQDLRQQATQQVSYSLQGTNLVVNYTGFPEALIDINVHYADGTSQNIHQQFSEPLGTTTKVFQLKSVCVTWIQVHGTNDHYYGTCTSTIPPTATPTATPRPTATPTATPRPTVTPRPTATPTATPRPTVTPISTPTGTPIAAVCMSITKDIQTPKLGDQVRFTCGTATNATRYEFRWKVNSAISGLNPISSGSNISEPLTITTAGVYKAQCRPCVGNSCTEWETF